MYYKDGKLQRKYIVSYPNFKDPVINVNYGDFLKDEESALRLKDPWEKITDFIILEKFFYQTLDYKFIIGTVNH